MNKLTIETRAFAKGKMVYITRGVNSGYFFKIAEGKYKVIENVYAVISVNSDKTINSILGARIINGEISTNEMIIAMNEKLKNKVNIDAYLKFLRVCCQKTPGIEKVHILGGHMPPQSDKELVIPDFGTQGSFFFIVPVDKLPEIEKNGEPKDSGELDTIILNHVGWVNSSQYAFKFSKEEETISFYDTASGCNLTSNPNKYIISYDKGSRRIRKILHKYVDSDGVLKEATVNECFFKPFSEEKVIKVGKFMPAIAITVAK